MRENSADPQTVMQALADRLSDVRFIVHGYDAVAMTAAMFREYRITSVTEGSSSQDYGRRRPLK